MLATKKLPLREATKTPNNIIQHNTSLDNNKDTDVGTIYQTYDYDKFHFFGWNRELNKTNIKKINKSIQEVGNLEIPIIVDPNYFIYEGQHRFYVWKENELPITYIIKDNLKPEHCQVINSKRRSWTTVDYIHYYAELGNTEYIWFEQLTNKYPTIPTTTLVGIVSTNTNIAGGKTTKKIVEGKMKIRRDFEEMHKECEYVEALIPTMKKIGGRIECMTQAVRFFYRHKDISNKRLMNQMLNRYRDMPPTAKTDQAIKDLEELYNYNLNNKVYVFDEYRRKKGI